MQTRVLYLNLDYILLSSNIVHVETIELLDLLDP